MEDHNTEYRVLVDKPNIPPDGAGFSFEAAPSHDGSTTYLTVLTTSNDIALYLGIDWAGSKLVLSRRIAGDWSDEESHELSTTPDGVKIELTLLPHGCMVLIPGRKDILWRIDAKEIAGVSVSGQWELAKQPLSPPDHYFCIFHEGRCGSTVLASLINQHPWILHFNEILTRGSWVSREFIGSDWERKREDLEICQADLADFIRSLPQARPTNASSSHPRHVGFEIKFYQLMQLGGDLQSVITALREGLGAVSFIFLTRRNILRRHVSAIRCMKKDVSHAKNLSDVNFDKVRVDRETLRDYAYDYRKQKKSLVDLLTTTEQSRQQVREFALENGHLFLEYEEFEGNPLSGAERIVDFLGVPRFHADSPLLKTGDRPLADLIENYGDVRDELLGTSWRTMLD